MAPPIRRPLGGATAKPSAPARVRDGRSRAGVSTLALDLPWILTILAISGIALALRLVNHSSNYDLFIDEITYSTIGQAVALGHGVSLYGTPFFLHPPLFFYLEAGVLQLFGGAHAAPVQLVLEMRPINCVIGAIECGLLMLLVERFTSRRAAIIVGLFTACDPFLLLWDGRVLLETLAMTTAIAGWICLDVVARREARIAAGEPVNQRSHQWMIGLTGVVFGVSLLSKETYAFVGVVPVLGMLVIGSPLRRRVTGTILGLAIACYAIFLATVLAAGHISLWWNQNTAGFQRALGTKQITGFNQAGHHASVGSRVGANLSLYAVSYIVIAAVCLAALFGAISWFRAARAGRELETRRRLAIALGVGSAAYIAYAVLFGAFEVQIFYMCILGGLPVLATEVSQLWPRLGARLNRRVLLGGAAVVGCAVLAFQLAADVRLRTQRDTSLSQLVSYVQRHVPNGEIVDSTDQVSQFILQGVRIDGPTTVRGVERDKPGWIVMDQGLVDQGYVTLGAGFEQWLKSHAKVVFSVTGRSTGRVELYKTIYAHGGPGGTV